MADEPAKRPWWRRVPRRMFGGRIATSSVLLVVVFVGLLLAYGQTTAHYDKVDRDKLEKSNSVVTNTPRRPAPTETREPEPTTSRPPTTTTTTTTDVPTSGSSATSNAPSTAPTGPSSSPSTTPPPFQIPGLPLPSR